jgi:hypothetical protein
MLWVMWLLLVLLTYPYIYGMFTAQSKVQHPSVLVLEFDILFFSLPLSSSCCFEDEG